MSASEQWEIIKEIFATAADLNPSARASYLDEACARFDRNVRAEVERLLVRHDLPDGLLNDNQTTDWPPQLFVEGEVLGDRNRFSIIRRIGRGGMGEVYEAFDHELNDHVALKTLRPELSAQPELETRFRREISLARRVTHPNVCRVFDVGRHYSQRAGRELAFLTMELLDGEDLSAHLKRRGPLPLAEALPIVRQIANGLQALHENNIVHRDFKPGNVILAAGRAGRTQAVITDFGLARHVIQESGPSQRFTRAGEVLGTPGYMAPEQLTGERIGPWTDIYAFGIVVRELLIGKNLSSEEEAKADTALRANPAIADLIKRCTAKEIAQRPAGLRQILEELGPDAADAALPGPQKQPRSREKRRSGRRFTPLPQPSGRRNAQADSETHRGRRTGGFVWAIGVLVLLCLVVVSTGRSLDLRQFSTDQLCSVFSGQSWACPLPEDKDLAIVPMETAGNGALAKGFEKYIGESLARLYPDKGLNCLHIRPSHTAWGTSLVLGGSIDADQSGLRLRLQLTRAKDGLVLRELDREVAFADLQFASEGVLREIAALLDYSLDDAELVRWRQEGPRDPDAFLAYIEGLGLLETERFREAAAAFDRAVQGQTGGLTFAAASARLGDAYRLTYIHTGDPEDAQRAENAYKQARSAPDSPLLYAGWAELDLALDDEEAAVQHLARAIELQPYDTAARIRLARTLDRAGRSIEAENVYHEGLELRPSCWIMHNGVAGHYLYLGDYDSSQGHLLRAINLHPANAAAYGNLGWVYLKQGRYNDAITASERSIFLNNQVHPPKEAAQGYSTLGKAFLLRECVDAGRRNLTHAVEVDPESFLYALNLAEGLLWLDDRDGAEPALTNAYNMASDELALDPDDEEALRVAARAAAHLGRLEEARQLAERLLEAASDRLPAVYTAAVVRELDGDRLGALAALEEGLEKGLTVFEVRNSPVLRNLRDDPDYLDLLQRLDIDPDPTPGAISLGGPCPQSGQPGEGFGDLPPIELTGKL